MTDCPSGNFIGQVRFALCCWFRQKWCLIVLDWWFVDVVRDLWIGGELSCRARFDIGLSDC